MFNKVKLSSENKHKYTTVFATTNFKVYDPSEEDVFVAKASYDNVKNFLPNIDFNKNYDLLGISFGGYITSRANLNGQVISGRAGKEIAPLFINKFIDAEHFRKNIKGVITNYGFADIVTEMPLSDEEVESRIAKEEPYLVCFGGVIWRLVDQEFAQELERRNDPFSEYTPIRASWEAAFTEFEIAEGSKNLSEARIIDNPKEIEEVYECLAHFGGSGISRKTNKEIYLCLGNNTLSLGMGLTLKPAQNSLQPVFVNTTIEDDEEEVKTTVDASQKQSDATIFEPLNNDLVDNAFEAVTYASDLLSIAASESEKNKENEKFLENSEKEGVIASTASNSQEKTNRKITSMKLTDIEQITDEALTKGEVTASALRDLLTSTIEKGGKDYADKLKEKEDALAGFSSKTQELETQLSTVKAELETLQNEAIAREKAEVFNTRLEGLATDYDFDEEEKQVVAERIKDLDQEGFEKYLKELAVFAKAKKKVPAVEKNKVENKEEKAKEVMASLQVDPNQTIPPNLSAPHETQKDKWVKAFGPGAVTVTLK